MNDLKVLRDFIAVEIIESPLQSSVIEIVRFDERLKYGIVKEVGTGVLAPNGECHPIEVKVGDTIVFDKMNSRDIVTKKGKKFTIVNELSVLAVLL
jgi:co-chaperonin GroES (HSP10)